MSISRTQPTGGRAGCWRRPKMAGRGLFLAIVSALGALMLSPGAVAMAAGAPTLKIEQPAAGNTEEQTPSFRGSTNDPLGDEVIVNLYSGPSASGSPMQTPSALPEEGMWKTGPVSPLRDGEYTAVAEETNVLDGETGHSSPVTFTVDTPPPQLAISSPVSGSSTSSGAQQVSGVASTASRDLPTVTIKLFAGTTLGESPRGARRRSFLERKLVHHSRGSWSRHLHGAGRTARRRG